MANMAGVRKMQPNLRAVPFVIDPFAVKHVDAVLATHYHQDHMSAEFAAHVIQSGMMTTDEKIIDIAKSLGFSSPQYLASQFRKTYGLTASDYRRTQHTHVTV